MDKPDRHNDKQTLGVIYLDTYIRPTDKKPIE